jgi:hypothetical protein
VGAVAVVEREVGGELAAQTGLDRRQRHPYRRRSSRTASRYMVPRQPSQRDDECAHDRTVLLSDEQPGSGCAIRASTASAVSGVT